jgi:AcrR family transcriptional regulator
VIKPPDIRRTELLDAAARLFQRDGYEAVTVAAIAAEAGVAKGTFYLYFDSKEALVESLRHRFSEIALAPLRELKPPEELTGWWTYTAALVRVAIATQVDAQAEHDLLRTLPHSHRSNGDRQDSADPVRAGLREIVEAGVSAGAYQVSDPEETSELLYVLLHAAADRACANPAAQTAITKAATEIVERSLLG